MKSSLHTFFFLTVAVQGFAIFEFGADDSLVDSLKVPDVRDEYFKSPHPITFEHGWHDGGGVTPGLARKGTA